jgi:hypothetical protein
MTSIDEVFKVCIAWADLVAIRWLTSWHKQKAGLSGKRKLEGVRDPSRFLIFCFTLTCLLL